MLHGKGVCQLGPSISAMDKAWRLHSEDVYRFDLGISAMVKE